MTISTGLNEAHNKRQHFSKEDACGFEGLQDLTMATNPFVTPNPSFEDAGPGRGNSFAIDSTLTLGRASLTLGTDSLIVLGEYAEIDVQAR
jgi:hypothetical protein